MESDAGVGRTSVSRQDGEASKRQPDLPLTDFATWVAPSIADMNRVARRLVPRSEADDVVQDALTRAWRKRSQFDPGRGSLTTWLLAITVDQARCNRRRWMRRRQFVDDSAALPDVAATTQVEDDAELLEALNVLTVRQRTAVELHYFVGLSIADTAATLRCSPGTVKSTLFDARQKLSRELENRNE